MSIKLPENLTGRAVSFMRLANGGHMQCYRNEEYKISIAKVKENRDTPWKNVLKLDALPGKEFSSFQEMKAYIKEHNL